LSKFDAVLPNPLVLEIGMGIANKMGEGETQKKQKGEKMMTMVKERVERHSLLGSVLADRNSPLAEAFEEGLPIFGPEVVSRHGKQHTPIVKAPRQVEAGQWFEVEVEVGFYHPHPNTPGHHIDSISLCVNGHEVANASLTAGNGAPKARFLIKIDEPGTAVLRGFGNCTLHGIWASFPVKVRVV